MCLAFSQAACLVLLGALVTKPGKMLKPEVISGGKWLKSHAQQIITKNSLPN